MSPDPTPRRHFLGHADHIEVFKGAPSEHYHGRQTEHWYWRVKAGNGSIISTGGESFTRAWSAKRAARRTNPGLPILVRK